MSHLEGVGEAIQAGERADGLPYLEGQHTSMVLVDVEKYGDPARIATDLLQVRRGMYGALEKACAGAGIPWERCTVDDRGDGVMILVPADVSKNRLVTLLPELLVTAIAEHNAECQPLARIRLRVGLHAGEVHHDERGQTSDSLIFAFRMLDSAEARAALAASAGVLVMIVSEWFYQNVVRHDPAASPGSYRPVRFVAKETSARAWIRRPGDTTGVPVTASSARPPMRLDIEEDRLTKVLQIKESDSLGTRQPALTTFVDRLLAIPTVAREAGRRLLMDHLRPDMANAVPYYSETRHHVFSLVRTCMNYTGGVEELLSVVRLLEGESTPVRRLNETVAELLARAPE